MKRKDNKNIRWQNSEADDLIPDLPLNITEIRGQSKNQNRFSLFHNERFLIGVSSKTLTDFSLQKGIQLTPSLYQNLMNAENFFAAKEKAYQYLSRRDHASFELRQKLRKKGFSTETIDDLLLEFSEKNLLNDLQFAVGFANDKATLNMWGPRKIEMALIKKGVQKKHIRESLKNTFDNLSKEHICVDLINKRKKHFLREENLLRRKQKIYSYLAGRGFSGEVIKKAIISSGITKDV